MNVKMCEKKNIEIEMNKKKLWQQRVEKKNLLSKKHIAKLNYVCWSFIMEEFYFYLHVFLLWENKNLKFNMKIVNKKMMKWKSDEKNNNSFNVLFQSLSDEFVPKKI